MIQTPKAPSTESTNTKTRATNSNSTRNTQIQSNYLSVARDTISSRSRQSRSTLENASQESETASKAKRQKTHHSKLEVKVRFYPLFIIHPMLTLW